MDISVFANGTLVMGNRKYPCAIGRNGVTTEKIEGDGTTPVGSFQLREVWYRADRIAQPTTSLPIEETHPDDGWCDDSDDTHYNQHIKTPYSAHHETLWREDDLYDLVVPIGYNDDPAIPEKGSAIFMHIARPGFSPTDGCIALRLPDLLDILTLVSSKTRIHIKRNAT
jgi:L,D-peptidoglycan transpeptidase YkuD (ErfK/YbiS/YcfS/YnhG family)